MLKYADDLLVIIEGMLEASSSAHKQEVVVRTLGQVVASTGLVVEPYNRFPNLLMILLNMLFTEPEQSVRKEVKDTYLLCLHVGGNSKALLSTVLIDNLDFMSFHVTSPFGKLVFFLYLI